MKIDGKVRVRVRTGVIFRSMVHFGQQEIVTCRFAE
jgi:hypothetical protein